MAIRDWPEDERPREKLLKRGAASLSDAELLAIFLRTGVVGKSALDIARDLITRFGSLRTLMDADTATLCQSPGLGPSKCAQLQAALEIGKRYLESTLKKGDALASPADTRRYLTAQLRHEAREVFACLFLDNRHRVICFEPLFYGTIDQASVHPREVVKRALYHNCAALILSHNHPSGVAEPSPADERITSKLKEALALVDVRVIDHIVVGDGETVSFAERGLI